MEILFFVMAILVMASAIGVVASRNPLHSALFLIVNLLTIAGLFAQLEAHFLATVQILVYAGAIMVLVVFVLMLLNSKTEAGRKGERLYRILAGVLCILFFATLFPILSKTLVIFAQPIKPLQGTVQNIGHELFTREVFPFEIASLLILGAIVGAVLLAGNTVVKTSDASKGGQA
jgi:NADH-quinone oxidoreductase subunit J